MSDVGDIQRCIEAAAEEEEVGAAEEINFKS